MELFKFYQIKDLIIICIISNDLKQKYTNAKLFKIQSNLIEISLISILKKEEEEETVQYTW